MCREYLFNEADVDNDGNLHLLYKLRVSDF